MLKFGEDIVHVDDPPPLPPTKVVDLPKKKKGKLSLTNAIEKLLITYDEEYSALLQMLEERETTKSIHEILNRLEFYRGAILGVLELAYGMRMDTAKLINDCLTEIALLDDWMEYPPDPATVKGDNEHVA